MKLFGLFFMLMVLSVPASADDSAWPLMPDYAGKLQQETAQDIYMGGFYFHYLNEDYQSAYNHLTQLRRQQQVDPNALAVLETTLLLALGAEDKALALFERIESSASTRVPAQAWLYLARRWQTVGQWSLAENAANAAYDSQTHPLSVVEAQEALQILVHCSVELEDTRSANAYFDRMAERGKWTEYARYNLLLASIEGYASLYDVGRQIEHAEYYFSDSEESLALKDRMYLLAGIYLMGEARYRNAEVLFQKVRQDSPYAAPALLEYGWAKLEQSRFESALQPWRVLQTQYASWHPAVVESILAVPHAMEKMEASTQALHSYQTVEERLLSMLAELNAQQQPSHIKQWLAHWLDQQEGDWGWRRHQVVMDQDQPLSRNLMDLLANSSLRNQLGELHDLKQMQHSLTERLEQLRAWQTTAQMRQQYLRSVDGDDRLQALETRYNRLATRVQQLEQQWRTEQKATFAYADQTQQRQIQRINTVVPLIKGLKDNTPEGVDLLEYMQRWRLTRGVLLWQMSKERPQKEHLISTEVRHLKSLMALLSTQLEHSQIALNASKTSWQGFASRIDQAEQEIQRLQQKMTGLQQGLEQQIVASMQTNLQQQEVKLTQYLAEARLALARLYDDHLQESLQSKSQSKSQNNSQANLATAVTVGGEQ